LLPTYLLSLSIVLQFTAAIAAFWLIRITGRHRAWVMISIALMFMGVRRCVTLYGITLGGSPHQVNLPSEMVAIVISALMTVGIFSIAPIFRASQRSAEALRQKNLLLDLLHQISAAANTPTGYCRAIQTALDTICQHTGWPIGHLYVVSKHTKDELEPTRIWHLQHPDRYNAFQEITESIRYQSGNGLPGQVHATGKPAWVIGLTRDVNFPRSAAAVDSGINAGLAFPVLVGDEVAAVLEFFATDAQEPDEALLEVMASIGFELGRVIERERSTEALKQSKHMLQSIVDGTNRIITIKDLQGRYILVNRRYEETFRTYAESVLGKCTQDIFPEEMANTILSYDRKAIEQKRSIEYEATVNLPGESLRHVSDNKFPLFDNEGNVYAVCGISTDITAQKLREDKLRASQYIIDHAGEAVFTINSEGRFINVNTTACDRLGYTRDELLGKHVWDIDPQCTHETWSAEWARTHKEGQDVFETCHQTKSGDLIPVEIVSTLIPQDDAPCICSFVRDITERKKAEATLRESEERFSLFMNHLPGSAHIMDENRRFVYINNHFTDTIGKTRGDWLGKTVDDIFPVDLAKTYHINDDRVYSNRDQVNIIEDVQQDDGVHHYLTRKFPMPRDANTTFMGSVSIDITDRVRAEDALRESEENLKEAQRITKTGHWIWNPQNGDLYWSDQLLRIFGEELTFQPSYESYIAALHDDDRQSVIKAIDDALDNIRPYAVDVRILSKCGAWKNLLVQGEVEFDEQGNAILMRGTAIDITERKQAEEALRISEQYMAEAQKIASLGSFEGDMSNDELYWSDELFRIHFKDPKTYTPTKSSFAELVHDDDRELYLSRLEHSLATGDPLNAGYRIVAPDGTLRTLHTTAQVKRDEAGKIVGMRGAVQDITDRKRAEQALRESKQQLDAFFTESPAGLAIVDDQLVYRKINKTLATLNGSTVEEHTGKTASQIMPKLAPIIEPMFQKVIDEGISYLNIEVNGETPHEPGAQRQWMVSYFPMRTDDGHVNSIGVVIFETTDRKRAEESLQKSHESFKQLADAGWEAIAIHEGGVLLEANEQYFTMFGYEADELIGVQVLPQTVAPDSIELVKNRLKSSDYEVYEVGGLKKGGAQFPAEVRSRTIDYHGRQARVAVIRDVTAHKEAERALRESRERWRSITENSVDHIMLLDRECRIQSINHGSPDSVVGSRVTDFLSPEQGQIAMTCLERVLATGEADEYDVEYVTPDGDTTHYTTTVGPVMKDDAVVSMIATARDVTKRKETESALRKSEMTSRALLEGSLVCNKIIDLDSRLQYMSTAGQQQLKITDIETYYGGPYPPEFYPDSMRAPLIEHLDRAKAGEISTVECPVLDAEGGELWYQTTFVPARDARGQVEYVIGTSVDITERVLHEKALRVSEQRFRSMFEQAGVAVALVETSTGLFVRVNKSYTELLGYSAQEMMGMTWIDTTHPDELKIGREHQSRMTTDKSKQFTREKRSIHKNGSTIWTQLTVSPIWGSDGKSNFHIAISQNITDRKQAEDKQQRLEGELRHAQKLEAIGTLAGGIAHDFNNVLTAIFGHIQIAQKDLPQNNPACETLNTIERIAKQGEAVTRALLTFAHKAPAEKHPIDLTPLLEESIRMLSRLLPSSIRIIEDFPHDTRIWVEADAGQIQQVLMNLTVNARDAMPEGGTIRISLGRDPNETPVGHNDKQEPSHGRVALAVEDNGPGMDEDTRSRIFEPFFTTKPRGEGTGLGLAIVHGIVKDHRGQIDASSKPGAGSRFTIQLPVCDPHDVAVNRPLINRDAKPGTGQTILLAEDNEFVREIMTTTLSAGGYHVISAADGEEALSLFNTHHEEVSMVILDQDMPKIGGKSCLAKFREKSDKLPVVIVTGNVDQFMKMNTPNTPPILKKPFQMADLIEIVNNTQPSIEKGAKT
jgi:two-component system cell cycle sensor histidine kinase/response regulator CckA